VPRIGTRSLLVGVHTWWLHPLFTAAGWWELFGPPLDPRLWVAFLVHDWGYWQMEHMDDAVGQTHPLLGGRIMGALFGQRWNDFTRLHSRYYARLEGRPPSPLCAADKLATARVPLGLYLLQCRLSGELAEYLAFARQDGFYTGDSPAEWARRLQAHFAAEAYRLAAEHRSAAERAPGISGGQRACQIKAVRAASGPDVPVSPPDQDFDSIRTPEETRRAGCRLR
jgi:hypothetical protein